LDGAKKTSKTESREENRAQKLINDVISSISKFINTGQIRIKKSIENIKNINLLSNDWIEDALNMLSNPISMDFLIDGVPKVFYDIFQKENQIAILIEIPNVSKEDISIKSRYKTIKVYIKNYLIEKIDLSKHLKTSIKMKNITTSYKGHILTIIINNI